MSEAEEIVLDKSHSPHQFSADFGAVQDTALNRYLTQVGQSMSTKTHRPAMPYSFRVVNATYVNAYAFPGGSIAATRGIMLTLENEAELAGLLGHELGHVNARHTAQRMTKSMLFGAALSLGTAVVASKSEKAAPWVAGLGSIGAGALLAHYSRDDERQADDLGMEYMVRSGRNPQGMVGLMDMLRSLSNRKPNVIEMMFATHPMSEERYQTAAQSSQSKYGANLNRPLHKERYMDNTAKLRKIRPAIESIQDGEKAMSEEKLKIAETHFNNALKLAPNDYVGLVMMAHCQINLEKPVQADQFAAKARKIYPEEAQAHHMGGIAKLMQKQYETAYTMFDQYEKMLPGNPNTIFLKGFSQEGMQHKPEAAQEYKRYLQHVNQGEQADHAREKLIEWGYLKKTEEKMK
jgi:predicted Zn-dependent protease